MSKTRAEIVEKAMFNLQVLGAGQPVEADDAGVFDTLAAAAYLAGRRTADLSATVAADGLPDEYFFPFASLVAALHGSGFGLPKEQCDAMREQAIEEISIIANRIRPVRLMMFDRMTY